MRYGAALLGLASTLSCVRAAEVTAEVTMDRCGGVGPRRIVALTPDEHVVRVHRWLARDDELLFEVVSDRGGRLVAADPCGEGERTIATGVELLEVTDDVLACDAPRGALLRIDPSAGSITELATDVACAAKPTRFGVLALRPATPQLGALLLLDPTGAGTGEVLLDEIRLPTGGAGASAFAADDTQVFAHRRDGSIVRVDLATRRIEVWREGAADFRIDPGHTRLVWQRGVPDDPDPLARGPVSRIDLMAGPDAPDVELFETRLSWTALPFFGPWIALRSHAWGDDRLFADDGRSIALPEAASVRGVVADDRVVYVLGTGDWHDVDLRVWDPRRDRHRQVLRGPGLLTLAQDQLEVFEPAVGFVHGRVNAHPWSGAATLELAADAAWPYVRHDEALSWVRDEDGDGRGPLQRVVGDDEAVTLWPSARQHDASLLGGGAFGDDAVVHDTIDGAWGLWRIAVPQ